MGSARLAIALTAQAIRKIAHRYREGGLERALYDRLRLGPAEILERSQKATHHRHWCVVSRQRDERWRVRLAVKRKLVPRVGRKTIRILLESHYLKPSCEKQCRAWQNSMRSFGVL